MSMSVAKDPGDRLDALLTALEDEVLQSDDAAVQSVVEDLGKADVGAIRSSMESLIDAYPDDDDRGRASRFRVGGLARGMRWMRSMLASWPRPTPVLAGVAGLALLAGVVVSLTRIAPPLSPDVALPNSEVRQSPAAADEDELRDTLVAATEESRKVDSLPLDIGRDESVAQGGSPLSEEGPAIASLSSESEDSSVAAAEPDAEMPAVTADPAVTAEQPERSGALARERERALLVLMHAPTASETVPREVLARSMASRAPAASRGLGVGEESSGSATRFDFSRLASQVPGATVADERKRAHFPDQGRDRFARLEPNPVKVVAEEPVSTFSIDVDTASYAFVRASLDFGVLPRMDAVRVEELINYFPYDYPGPASRESPFAASVSVFPAPWNDAARLLHIGIKGYALGAEAVPRANLVFLVDTSGSMDEPNKLPLLVQSLKLLVGSLAPEDTVAIVTYAGSAGTVLAPTPARERGRIRASLERLRAGGSTAGAEGIRQAYLLAEQHFVEGGINRVILATDGDFNVGITDLDELEGFVARKRETGVFLSVLGFGMGNYNDELMQRLAQNGNGTGVYIDSLSEARKALVEEATSMLFPIAKDVKIQVEFDPSAISEYRLIGYETRLLAREDFSNDRVDAGEIGSGHTVTAIYEVIPAGSSGERIDPLRYGREDGAAPETGFDGELAFLKIRYKLPDADTSTLVTRAVTSADAVDRLEEAPAEARFATAVAGFGQLLRGGRYTGDYGYDDVIALAQGARGEDPFGYRAEFVGLARLAESAATMAPLRP